MKQDKKNLILDADELQKKLNQIKLKKIEDIRCGDVLHYPILDIVDYLDTYISSKKERLKAVPRIIKNSCVDNYEFIMDGKADILFLFSNSSRGRDDHLKAFMNAQELYENRLTMKCTGKQFTTVGLKILPLAVVWNRQMKEVVQNFTIRSILIATLVQCCLDYQIFIKKAHKDNLNIKALVSYCDVMPVDCFFTQKFNSHKKITVTLQHGTFIVKTNAWAYAGAKSKYFLAESPYTVDCAKRAGYKGITMPVGSPHQLEASLREKPKSFKAEKLGLFLNSPMRPHEDNIQAINVLQEYCKKNNCKLLIKYHPANDQSIYEKIIDKEVSTTYGTDISAVEFGNMIDVAVVNASTVFNTMLSQWIPVLLFERKGYAPEMFFGVDELTFFNVEELKKKLHWILSDEFYERMDSYRNYFLCSGDLKTNYKNAFSEIKSIFA